jgi:hypothetical protein
MSRVKKVGTEWQIVDARRHRIRRHQPIFRLPAAATLGRAASSIDRPGPDAARFQLLGDGRQCRFAGAPDLRNNRPRDKRKFCGPINMMG